MVGIRSGWLAGALALAGIGCGDGSAAHVAFDASVATDAGDASAVASDASDGGRAKDGGTGASDAGNDGGRDAGRDAGLDASLPPEPALATPTATLDAALHCPDSFASLNGPILLVHGTGANADIEWTWGFLPALVGLGYDVCTVDLPAWAWEDAQVATETVVHAIRTIAARSHRKLAVVGHSQGTLELRWALTWWPSLRSLVTDYVGLAGADHGAAPADTICALGFCRAAAWQMRASSEFLSALNAVDETPGSVSYTSVYSTTDTTAVAPTSVLAGASNVAIQSLCDGRKVSHGAIVADAVAFALLVDALSHPGPADPSRIDPTVCASTTAPGIDPGTASSKETQGATVFATTYLAGPEIGSEPALAPYVIVP